MFADLRWPGWEQEVSELGVDQGFSVYPPPFSREGKDIALVRRRAVPLEDIVHFYADMAAQLG